MKLLELLLDKPIEGEIGDAEKGRGGSLLVNAITFRNRLLRPPDPR